VPVIVSVLGASGRTGRFVSSHLFASGHDVLGIVRRPETIADVGGLGRPTGPGAEGVHAVVVDLLGDRAGIVEAITGSDAIINAAGSYDPEAAGPTVDREGAIAAIEAAKQAGVSRFIQISSMYADHPGDGPEFLRGVLRAKHDSDTALQDSGLDWTIVRPGGLTDSGLTGQVTIAAHLTDSGVISREDVAAIAGSCLAMPRTIGFAFDVVAGQTPLLVALDALTA
jgi:uncharacterized protein YbjT (DUF2867 family)